MKNLLLSLLCVLCALNVSAQQVSEKLNRMPVAVKATNGNLVSWRLLTTDPDGITFDVYRGDTRIAENIGNRTNYLDADGNAGDTYKIVTSTGETSECRAWDNIYTTFKVQRPAAITSGNTTGRYRPDDMSVGDVDGDGDYEYILKWMPDNARDNGSSGYSSPCIIDCYKYDALAGTATQLWRINLGLNIRSGNHYTQFLVYDFDGDGKAEVTCKTAPGSIDGKGNYVSLAATDATIKAIDNTKSYVNSNGHVTGGEELLTIFNGETGAAMHTIWYNPARSMGIGATGATSYGKWESEAGKSTNYNRGERYNACVAYLDGLSKLPSIIYERGYYNSCFLWAVDWNGTTLTQRWLHAGDGKSSWKTYDGTNKQIYSGTGKSSYGQGVHGISVGDVNNDGYDEICIGSATIAHDGQLLCSTGKGHGDAIHLADLVPDRPGLEVMMPHEESPYGYDVHDATTGELLVYETSSGDNGRGLAADFVPEHYGCEFWSSANTITTCDDGTLLSAKKPDTNFRIYWTGAIHDQTFDGRYDSSTGTAAPRIMQWNSDKSRVDTYLELSSYGNPMSCNSTKATPCLQADLFGDWREEIVMFQYESNYNNSECTIMIFSTPDETKYKVPCLMQDHVYRMGVAWQNSAYNQPPHLGYYLPDRFQEAQFQNVSGTARQNVTLGEAITPLVYSYRNCTKLNVTTLPDGITFSQDETAKTFTISGTPTAIGTSTITVSSIDGDGSAAVTLTIVVRDPSQKNPDSDIEGVLYYWESPEGTVREAGGLAVAEVDDSRVNYLNGSYYTISLCGKGAEISTGGAYVEIILNNAIEAGNVLDITAYRNKDTDADATFYFLYDNGVEVKDDQYINNLQKELASGEGYEQPGIVRFELGSDVAGCKSIKMSRNTSGTNIFITKIMLYKDLDYANGKGGDGIISIASDSTVSTDATIYSLSGQRISTPQRGSIYIIKGKKAIAR